MAIPAFADGNVLRMALIGYEQEKRKIEAAIADVQTRLGDSTPAVTAINGSAPKKRTMSAAARRRIALAQKRRWAAAKAEKADAEKPAAKPKRKMSAAGRARIVAATKKRWSAVHKAQRAAAKKAA